MRKKDKEGRKKRKQKNKRAVLLAARSIFFFSISTPIFFYFLLLQVPPLLPAPADAHPTVRAAAVASSARTYAPSVPAAVPALLPALGDAHVLRHVALRPRLEESLRALAARVLASAKKTHPTTESTRHRRQRTETENGRVVRWWV